MHLAAVLLLLAQEQTVFYEFPAGTKDAEATRNIKAVQARIDEAKYSGIKVLALKRNDLWAFGVHSAGPIGDNLLAALNEFATRQASKIEIFQRREMNAQELDLYKPGGKAPPNCVWRSWNGTPILLEKSSTDISAGFRWSEGDKTAQHSFIGVGVPYFEVSAAMSAKIDSNAFLKKAVLTIDGKFINGDLEYHHPDGSVKGMRITGAVTQDKVLGICINHPLSLEIKSAN